MGFELIQGPCVVISTANRAGLVCVPGFGGLVVAGIQGIKSLDAVVVDGLQQDIFSVDLFYMEGLLGFNVIFATFV